MTDKYAHLSPRRYRSCTRRDGKRKAQLTHEEAVERAAQMTADKGIPCHAYRCPVCDWWHTAKTPRPDEEATPA